MCVETFMVGFRESEAADGLGTALHAHLSGNVRELDLDQKSRLLGPPHTLGASWSW